jgi:hypothetical protein
VNQFAPIATPGVSCARGAYILRGGEPQVNVVDHLGVPICDGTVHSLGTVMSPQMVDVAALPKVDNLPGTWLFAGLFWPHFGHFLFESLSRLWALSHIAQPIDGLVFASKKPVPEEKCADPSFQRTLLRKCRADLPVKILHDSVQVENLIVPRQACALGALAAGTPEFRDFIKHSLRGDITPGPHDKIYISRQGYRLRRGGHFDEARLVALLENEGYHIFRPERVSLDDQIATYMGASRIVSSDSTALHLAAFLARPDQQIAIILRRKDGDRDITPNIAACTGQLPLVIDAITGFHIRQGMRNLNWAQFAEIDFEQVGQALGQGGFIDRPEAWTPLRFRRRRRVLDGYRAALACEFDTVQAETAA